MVSSARPTPKLAVAFDLSSREEVFALAKELNGLPIVVKLGLGILPFLNRDDFKALREQGFDLFIDMKLHDIASQVARAVATWGTFGAKYLTLHCGGATQMLGEAVEAAKAFDMTLLGVTVLTSLNEQHLVEVGWSRTRDQQVKFLTEQGLKSGLRGFVCPPREVAALKSLARAMGFQNVVGCTPGLVLSLSEKRFDQPDCFLVEEAVKAGSDLLVVGRSVLGATDRVQAVKEILAKMESAK